MGFGHRVYKNYDPRARSCRRPARGLAELGIQDDPLSRVADGARAHRPHDEYFIERSSTEHRLLFRASRSKALGFPITMFTVCSRRPHGRVDRAVEEMVKTPCSALAVRASSHPAQPGDYTPLSQGE